MNNSKNSLVLENLLYWEIHDLYIQLIKKCINDSTNESDDSKPKPGGRTSRFFNRSKDD